MAVIENQANVTSRYSFPDFSTGNNNINSNMTETTIMTDLFIKTRTSASSFAIPNGEVLQVLTLTNNSDFTIENVKIYDTISNGGYFKEGSMHIDNVAFPNYDASMYTLANPIQPNQSVNIAYIIKVEENPTSDIVLAISNVNYTVQGTTLSENSNRSEFEIIQQKILITKSSNLSTVISGDTLTYTNEIKNEGNVINSELNFKDEIPSETTFVDGSVLINDISFPTYNPINGFALDDLNAGEKHIVKFSVLIK